MAAKPVAGSTRVFTGLPLHVPAMFCVAEAERLAECVGRLVQPAQATQGHAVIAVIVRLVGLLLHGQGDQFGGPVVVSLLMSHDPEQVQRPGMLRVSLENAAIQRLGLGEPPGLVQSDRDREWVGGGFHGLFVSLNDDNALIDNRPTHGFFPSVLAGMGNL
jgi:hypothetical protein